MKSPHIFCCENCVVISRKKSHFFLDFIPTVNCSRSYHHYSSRERKLTQQVFSSSYTFKIYDFTNWNCLLPNHNRIYLSRRYVGTLHCKQFIIPSFYTYHSTLISAKKWNYLELILHDFLWLPRLFLKLSTSWRSEAAE